MKPFLSPRELGDAIGVSESSVKRWIDEGRIEASRTAGGHRRVETREAVRFVRETGMPVVEPQSLGLPDLARMKVPEDDPSAPLLAALMEGRESETRGILLSQFLAGRTVAELCDDQIGPAMRAMGAYWESREDEEGVFREHRATDLCLQALEHVRALLPAPPQEAPCAVGGALSGDPYLLGPLSAACSLTEEGWHAVNLGPDTPWEVLEEAAKEAQASLVFLSLSAPAPKDLAKRAAALAGRLRELGAGLVIGGRCLPSGLRVDADNVHLGATMRELVAYVRGLKGAA